MPTQSLRLSRAGQNLIKHFESCLQPIGGGNYEAYVDPVGVLTIGWGHTNHHGRQFGSGGVWTRAECDQEFLKDMALFEADVKRLVKVDLKQWQFDALVSFAYNCGTGNLSKSTLLRKVNAGDFDGAAIEFHKWNKGSGKVLNGLVRRRASESLLFQNIPDVNYDGRPDAVRAPDSPEEVPFDKPVQRVDPVPTGEKPPSESKTVWTKLIEFLSMGGAGLLSALGAIDWKVMAVIMVGIMIVGTFFVIRFRMQGDDINKGGLFARFFGS